MNNKFDELAKGLAQSVTRRQALKKFGVGLAGIALACFGLADKAGAAPRHAYCQVEFTGPILGLMYTGMCIDPTSCVSVASADCPARGTAQRNTKGNTLGCLITYDTNRRCSPI